MERKKYLTITGRRKSLSCVSPGKVFPNIAAGARRAATFILSLYSGLSAAKAK